MSSLMQKASLHSRHSLHQDSPWKKPRTLSDPRGAQAGALLLSFSLPQWARVSPRGPHSVLNSSMASKGVFSVQELVPDILGLCVDRDPQASFLAIPWGADCASPSLEQGPAASHSLSPHPPVAVWGLRSQTPCICLTQPPEPW